MPAWPLWRPGHSTALCGTVTQGRPRQRPAACGQGSVAWGWGCSAPACLGGRRRDSGCGSPTSQLPLLPVLPAKERIRPSAGCRSEVAPTVPFFVVWDTVEQFGATAAVCWGAVAPSLSRSPRDAPPVQGTSLWGEPREGGHFHVLHLLFPPRAQSLWELL